ncbi:hypothetical protein ACJX0J_018890 [Zea mays]
MAAGRFIQDNFMLLDITKAFDSVSWPFLIEEGLDYSTLSLQVPWVGPPIVDKIANQLPGWKADFVLVQSVLTGLLPFSGEAIEDNGWINDIPGSLSVGALADFLRIWDLFEPFERIWKTWAPPKCRFFLWLWWHQANEAIQGEYLCLQRQLIIHEDVTPF